MRCLVNKYGVLQFNRSTLSSRESTVHTYLSSLVRFTISSYRYSILATCILWPQPMCTGITDEQTTIGAIDGFDIWIPLISRGHIRTLLDDSTATTTTTTTTTRQDGSQHRCAASHSEPNYRPQCDHNTRLRHHLYWYTTWRFGTWFTNGFLWFEISHLFFWYDGSYTYVFFVMLPRWYVI